MTLVEQSKLREKYFWIGMIVVLLNHSVIKIGSFVEQDIFDRY